MIENIKAEIETDTPFKEIPSQSYLAVKYSQNGSVTLTNSL